MVHGEDGAVTLNSVGEPSHIVLHRRGAEPEVVYTSLPVRPGDTMSHEIDVFADQIEQGTTDPQWRDLTLAVRRIMDEHLA